MFHIRFKVFFVFQISGYDRRVFLKKERYFFDTLSIKIVMTLWFKVFLLDIRLFPLEIAGFFMPIYAFFPYILRIFYKVYSIELDERILRLKPILAIQ